MIVAAPALFALVLLAPPGGAVGDAPAAPSEDELPLAKTLSFSSPLMGSGPGGWGGFESFTSRGVYAAVQHGSAVDCYEAVDHEVFYHALAPRERAALSAHLKSVPTTALARPVQVRRMLAILDGEVPPAEVTERELSSLGGPPGNERNLGESVEAYCTELRTAETTWWVCCNTAMGWMFWRPIEAEAIPSEIAERTFDYLLEKIASGRKPPLAAIEVYRAAGVPDAETRAAFAHPRGPDAGRRDLFGPRDRPFDARGGSTTPLVVEDTGLELRAWRPAPVASLLKSLPAEGRSALADRLETAAGAAPAPAVSTMLTVLRGTAGLPDGPEGWGDPPPEGERSRFRLNAGDDFQIRFTDGRWEVLERWPLFGIGGLYNVSHDGPELFETTVLPRARDGRLIPAYVARFYDQTARVPDADEKIAAAVRGG